MPASSAAQLPLRSFRLDNGLSVVVSSDRTSPTVAVSLTYKVGSQNERPGLSGFAHLFEHLMAQGTRNLAPREISRLIEHNGGIRNAYTTKTHTGYYSLVPRSALRVVLWAEADRMHTLDVDERALALEQQVVLEEMRLNYLNKPYRRAQTEAMGAAAFRKWENRHTTIGDAEDIRNARLEDVRAFYQAHYAPNNAVLALSGDVTPEEAEALVREHFGRVPSRPVAPPPDLSEPPLEGERRVEVPDPLAKLPRTMVGWRIPERGSGDFWALSLLMDLLTGGEDNPLYQALVKEARVALSANAAFPWWTSHATMRGPDLFGLDMLLKSDARLDAVLAAADRVLERFAAHGPTEDELERVKAQTELGWLGGYQSQLERAKLLSSYAALTGDPDDLTRDLEAILVVTPAQVRDVAARWIRGRGRVVVSVVPAPPAAPAAEPKTPPVPPERPRSPGARPPAVEAASTMPIPALHRFRLSNGLNVLFVRDPRLPLFEARLSFRAGKTAEREGEDGFSDAAVGLVFKGAGAQDAQSISKAFARLGSSIGIESRKEAALVWGSGLARNAAPFFRQLARVLAGADYPAAEVALWRENMRERLRELRADPDFLGGERLKAELFPRHPYGKPFLDEAALARVSAPGLQAFRARAIAPEGGALVLVGDLESESARAMLEEALGGWTGGSGAADPPPLPDSGPARLAVVDRPGSRQVNLTLARTIRLTPRDAAYAAFVAMNHILGGTSTARLFLNLRIDKGYTYGAYARAVPLKRGLTWVANAETRLEVARAALDEMRAEIRGLREREVEVEALEAAKRNLAGLFSIRLASMDTAASYLWDLQQAGLDPAEELARYLPRLRALTPADIRNAAERYLDPAGMVAIAVGERAAIEAALK